MNTPSQTLYAQEIQPTLNRLRVLKEALLSEEENTATELAIRHLDRLLGLQHSIRPVDAALLAGVEFMDFFEIKSNAHLATSNPDEFAKLFQTFAMKFMPETDPDAEIEEELERMKGAALGIWHSEEPPFVAELHMPKLGE